MRGRNALLLLSAMICQYGAAEALTRDVGAPPRPPPGSSPVQIQRYSEVALREVPDEATLCFLLTEKDAQSQLACKHRLARSKFNYNPFGLRFGKRDSLPKTDVSKWRAGQLLPILLYQQQLAVST
uniref:Kisspeptin n=1 Tax=Denticeps clupeoides TaxID=299321 RepID=A0AAY4AX40_9TELE